MPLGRAIFQVQASCFTCSYDFAGVLFPRARIYVYTNSIVVAAHADEGAIRKRSEIDNYEILESEKVPKYGWSSEIAHHQIRNFDESLNIS